MPPGGDIMTGDTNDNAQTEKKRPPTTNQKRKQVIQTIEGLFYRQMAQVRASENVPERLPEHEQLLREARDTGLRLLDMYNGELREKGERPVKIRVNQEEFERQLDEAFMSGVNVGLRMQKQELKALPERKTGDADPDIA